MLHKDGVPSKKDLEKVYPKEERLKEGPVAIVECFQEIPCNPCYTACPRGAIQELLPIHQLPLLQEDLCTGCGICITYCPGLAIFVVDLSYHEGEALVKIPWEMLPIPAIGDEVKALNRGGEPIGTAKIQNILIPKGGDKTYAISLLVPKALALEVRSIKVVEDHGEG